MGESNNGHRNLGKIDIKAMGIRIETSWRAHRNLPLPHHPNTHAHAKEPSSVEQK